MKKGRTACGIVLKGAVVAILLAIVPIQRGKQRNQESVVLKLIDPPQ